MNYPKRKQFIIFWVATILMVAKYLNLDFLDLNAKI